MTIIKDINNPEKQDRIKALCKKKEVIDMAVHEYERVTSNSYIKEQMDAIEKAEHDEASRLYNAVAKGKAELSKAFAIKLKAKGLSIQEIADLTELTIGEIQGL